MSKIPDTRTPPEPEVTYSNGQNQYWIADGRISGTPAVIDDFQVNRDVIVLSNLGLSRDDLRFTQQDDATLVSVQSSAIGSTDEAVPLALLNGVSAIDLDPATVVQRMYDALNREDIPGVLELLADDILWEVPGPQDLLPWAGAWHGHAGMLQFFDLFGKIAQTSHLSPRRLITQRDTVIAIVERYTTNKITNLSYWESIIQLVTVQHGKITALQFYMDSFPVVEALMGGRPFTILPAPDDPHYVVVPIAAKPSTDVFVFDPAELTSASAALQAVKRMYAALQASDWTHLREAFANDIFWYMFGPTDLLSWAGPRRGQDQALKSAQQIFETIKIDYSRPVRIIAQGNTIVTVIDEGGTSTKTGLSFKTSVIHLITVSESGTIKQVLNYINTTWLVEAFLGGRPLTIALPF